MNLYTPQERDPVPIWAWGVLGVLLTYLVVMYGGVMRVYLNNSVVLKPYLLSQPEYRLYENVIDIRLPGSLWLELALYQIVPDALLRVRLSMIVLAGLSMGLIFWLARRWWGLLPGLAGALLYAGWAPVIMDRLMYFDVLLGFFTLAAVAVWHRTDAKSWQPPVAGLLVGLGVLVKQHELAVAAVFVIWRLLGASQENWRPALADITRFLIAAALPVALTVLVLAAQGRLDEAIFWTLRHPLSQYLPNRSRGVTQVREVLLIAGWLALVPLYALSVLPRPDRWRRNGLLLLGLVPALVSPAFPGYGRFHLSGAVPIVALIGAGGVRYLLRAQSEGRVWHRRVLGLYGLGAAGLLLIALALPTYYRVRLGPRIGEYEALVPVGEWVVEQSGAGPGTRVWLLPEYDPTNNFYAVTGYLPPTLWVQTAKMHQVPGLSERFIAALDEDPPLYALLIHRWRTQMPEDLLDYLDAHYTPISEAQIPNEIGTVTLYELSR